jgi:hypothetical protein
MRKWAIRAQPKVMRPSPPERLLRLVLPRLLCLQTSIKILHLETNLGPLRERPTRDANLTFPNDLTSANKFTLLFGHRHATAREGCLHALKDWTIDATDTPTSVLAVVMEVALNMDAPLMVR